MISLLFVTMLTCNQVHKVIQRIHSNVGLPAFIREELIHELYQSSPHCPVIIKEDERRKSN